MNIKRLSLAIILIALVLFIPSCSFIKNGEDPVSSFTTSESNEIEGKENELLFEFYSTKAKEYFASLKEGKTTYHIDNEEPFDIFLPLDFEEYCTQLTDGATSFDL